MFVHYLENRSRYAIILSLIIKLIVTVDMLALCQLAQACAKSPFIVSLLLPRSIAPLWAEEGACCHHTLCSNWIKTELSVLWQHLGTSNQRESGNLREKNHSDEHCFYGSQCPELRDTVTFIERRREGDPILPKSRLAIRNGWFSCPH